MKNNLNSKKVISTVILFFCVAVFARTKHKAVEDTSKPKTFTAEWKINGIVTKLYETPMGEVFRFFPSPRLGRHRINGLEERKIRYKDTHSIQFELFKNSKEREKVRRFIVIDLKIRVFPAISEIKKPNLVFSLTRSENAADSIKKYNDINGVSVYATRTSWRNLPLTRFKPLKSKFKGGSIGLGIFPAYEVVSMRLIIDSRQYGFVSSNINRVLAISSHTIAFPNNRYPVRSFGILIESEPKREDRNRLILEVSKPKITFIENEADLLELPPVEPEEYPYSGYVKMLEDSKKRKRNLKRLNNPDAIYGNARHLLEGKDLVEGVKLLTYIAKKYDHVLAMNQLGICYWRGIGVEPDVEEALKWFKRAGKYNLPDALAYGAALCLTRASKPYISPSAKRNIYYMLNHNDYIYNGYNGGKHATSVLFAILNHAIIVNNKYVRRSAGIDERERSPKLAYWLAKNNRLRDFYKNSFYENKGIPPVKTGMTDKYKKNKYYDIRELFWLSWHIPDGNISKKTIDNAVKANFPAAMYFKGQLLIAQSKKEDRKSALKKAMSIFKQGEKLGDIECAIEVLHCKARLGELKPEDFNNENFVKFSDHPLYYLLKYIVKSPNAPGVKEFLNRDYRAARRIWQKKLTPKNHFLLALEGIYQYYHYGADTAMYRIYYGDIHDIKMAYEHLDAAVKANIPGAIYLKGVYLLDKKYNYSAGMRSGDISEGISLLRMVTSKNMKAQYYIIKNNFYNNKSMNTKWLQQLKPLRDLNFADAWLLSSDILARLSQGNAAKRKKVIGAYEKTASLGCYRAWDRLAIIYYKNSKTNDVYKAKAEEYWKKFLEADKQQRRNNPFDPYWPKPSPPKIMTLAFANYGHPVPGGTIGITYTQLVSWLRKYYKIIGSLEKDKQHPQGQRTAPGPRTESPGRAGRRRDIH